MNHEIIQHPPDRSVVKARFLAKFGRYANLLRRKWWVLVLGVGLGIVAQLVLWRLSPASFTSQGRMIVSIKLAIPEGSVYTEELSNFLGTQAALMQSQVVVNRAHERVIAQKPEIPMQQVALKVSVLPKTTIFILQAAGSNPEYTQTFLQSVMEEYVKLKREMRAQTSDTTFAGLTEEVLRLEKELRKSDEEMVQFQNTNSVVLLQEQGNSAGNYLAALHNRLAGLKSEHELLQTLTLEQNLERQQQLGGVLASDPSEKPNPGGVDRLDTDYLKAKQQILLLKADQQDWGQYLRPKHPKMISLSDEIARRERLLDIYRQQSAEQLENRKGSLALQIQTLEKDVREWDTRTLEISRKTAEYQRLKANGQRIQTLYDRLLATMQTLDLTKEISPESVTIMEKASRAFGDRAALSRKLLLGALVGAACAILLLLFIDRMDDRMNSYTELQELFDETVLGQIPREKPAKGDELGLMRAEDTRHAFVEAYRNLRSSLLYLSQSDDRPRTLLITSSVPNEGKSLTASNLAIALANTGCRVLLVDGDLRKGVIHNRFALPSDPGLSEALAQGLNWTEAVRPTPTANLSLLPRGAFTQNSSELFIGKVAQKFLTEAAAAYDYVIMDTAPVMAADDETSLAPHLDGVLFVIRAESTSARVARAALELLYQRQVCVLGLVFNAVRPSSSDYYCYHKYKDYYQYPSAGAGERKAKAAKA